MKLLMIDNYDSFTFNLIQLFREFDLDTEVHRHDMIGLDDIEQIEPDWICISPGPKAPKQAGISMRAVADFMGNIPILGVCLGMQVINEVFGGRTVRALRPVHGKRSLISHQGEGVFAGLPSPFHAARYHSLAVDDVSDDLKITARSEDGVIMGLAHREWPLFGVQFHPESFLSSFGLEMAANFLKTAPGFTESHSWPDDPSDRFPRWHDPEAVMPDLGRGGRA